MTLQNHDWSTHHAQTRDNPPSSLLVKALEFVPQVGAALDIGGGALKDTRYLLGLGFEVTVVDQEELVLKAAEEIESDKLRVAVSLFEDFDFLADQYVLVSAMYALPFNPPATFDEVFARIKQSLVSGGIFCGQFFGVRDEWSSNPEMTFHTRPQIEALLEDLEIIQLTESEKDGHLASGALKHWHVFHCIVRKL